MSVEGIPVQSKQIVSKTNNLDNKTVFVRFGAQAEPVECRVIRADDLLLQDVNTKRYFSGRDHKLEHVSVPEQEGTEVTYVLERSGKITVSYMVQGMCKKQIENVHIILSIASSRNQLVTTVLSGYSI